MDDHGEGDTSHISEADFPIRCDRCARPLDGLGESGHCAACGLAFHRRDRLWQTYGPEAFARPRVTPDEYEPTWTGSAFVAGTLFGLLLAAVVPVAVWVARDWLGVADPWFVLFAWAVIATAVIWLVVSRYRPRGDADQRPSRNGRPTHPPTPLPADDDEPSADVDR